MNICLYIVLSKSSWPLSSTLEQTKRYSGSHHANKDGEFKRSVMIYTLLGAGISAGIFGVCVLFLLIKLRLCLIYFLVVRLKYFYTGDKPDLSKKAASGSTKRYVTSTKVEKAEGEQAAAEAEEETAVEEAPQKAAEPPKAAEPAKKATEPPSKKEEHQQQQQKPGEDRQKLLPDIPSHVPYLIIGGGTAALSAFKAIRANDPVARVSFLFFLFLA